MSRRPKLFEKGRFGFRVEGLGVECRVLIYGLLKNYFLFLFI